MFVAQILVYWPISVAFEIDTEDLKINNLPGTEQISIDVIQERDEILRSEIQNQI
jgi:hypothetical protein